MARFWEQVIAINDYQVDRFIRRILRSQFTTLVGKKVAVFGFAFKPDTGDTRDAPAIPICRRLLMEKAHLSITDPHALPNARRDLDGLDGNLSFVDDPYEAARGAHALLLITEWKEYRDLDYEKIFIGMEQPASLFDGRNHLDHQALHEIGFNVYPLGKPALLHI